MCAEKPSVGFDGKGEAFLWGGGFVDVGLSHGTVLYQEPLLGHEFGLAAHGGARAKRSEARAEGRM
jgi:hypothetical protein